MKQTVQINRTSTGGSEIRGKAKELKFGSPANNCSWQSWWDLNLRCPDHAATVPSLNKSTNKQTRGLVSKETVMLRRWKVKHKTLDLSTELRR